MAAAPAYPAPPACLSCAPPQPRPLPPSSASAFPSPSPHLLPPSFSRGCRVRAALAGASAAEPRGRLHRLRAFSNTHSAPGPDGFSGYFFRRSCWDLTGKDIWLMIQEFFKAEVITTSLWNDFVLHCEVPVMVELWASWCGPCSMVHRVIDEIAREYAGRIKCFKLNTDEYPQVPTFYNIEQIPTVLLFKNGEKLESFTGTMPKSVYVAAIEKSLSN